jgi:hypothetical protein
MHDKSRLFIQTSQADMIKNNEFDTIYHEHLSFFNSSSMSALSARAGLHIIDIQKTPIPGNSYLFVMAKMPGARPSVKLQLDQEREQGLQDMNTYLAYADHCYTIISDLNSTLDHYRGLGYKLVGYGAAAKGNTLLNFGKTKLDMIIDDNPMKQELYSPGMSIPVVAIDALDSLGDTKVAFVPLAWNFFKEISSKIKTKRDQEGDVFIKYFPTVSVN